jgi:hypothetical protein
VELIWDQTNRGMTLSKTNEIEDKSVIENYILYVIRWPRQRATHILDLPSVFHRAS